MGENMNLLQQKIYDRFVRYTAVDTTSDPESSSVPSTSAQISFAHTLAAEMKRIGLAEVEVDEYGFVTGLLPADTTSLLMLGFLRKDVAIALLEPFQLSAQMLVVACVFMTMYLPCIATFFVMLRENGWKDTLRVVGLTLGLALVTGFVLRLILL